jgi:hypothetical protein
MFFSDVIDLDFLTEFSTDADDRIEHRGSVLTPVFDTFQDDAKVVICYRSFAVWTATSPNIP